jgi:hypothetical protein
MDSRKKAVNILTPFNGTSWPSKWMLASGKLFCFIILELNVQWRNCELPYVQEQLLE